MEDVLDVYKRPYDPRCPQVCLDETSKQLIGETRTPVPAAPGRETRYDHEYRHNGVANLFMIFEPLGGKRHVKVTERRTKKDWAECVREMVDEMYPDAEQIVLVMDNLNTHTPASLYEAFPPDEAKRIAGWRFTIRPSTGAGWTWPRSNWASWVVSVWIGASTTRRS